MSKEFSIEEMSELMILFEQAEALLNDDERKALSDAETTFSRIIEAKTKQYEGDVPPIEKNYFGKKLLIIFLGLVRLFKLNSKKPNFSGARHKLKIPCLIN